MKEPEQLVQVRDLGLIPYREALQVQTELRQELITAKRSQRELPLADQVAPTHHLLWCEHSPVFTLGKSGKRDHLLISEGEAQNRGIEFYPTSRGGDITYHGPGQIVCYPILDLDCFFTDVHKYVRMLEEAVIRTLSDYDLAAMRIRDFTGVWLERDEELRKICAIGVHLSRWVTMHGFALNVNTDLSHFNLIVPCGIDDESKTVTTLEREIGRKVDLLEVKEKLGSHLADLFPFRLI